MSFMQLSPPSQPGLGCPAPLMGLGCPGANGPCPGGCPGVSGLGQAAATATPWDGVINLISTVVGEGARFIPESSEMKKRRKLQAEIAAQQAARAQTEQATTIKAVGTFAAIAAGGVLLWSFFRARKKR